MGGSLLVGLFGSLILTHAAYATIQYRSVLKIMEEEFSGPPMTGFDPACGCGAASRVRALYVSGTYRAREVSIDTPRF